MSTIHDARIPLSEVDRWAGFLHEHGYAVVSGAVTRSDADEALDALWAIVEALAPEGGVRRDRPATWRRGKAWPYALHGGMIQYLGHTAMQWRLRELCAPLFARYYDVPEHALATSFDGLCMMSGARRYRPQDRVSFLHTDQSPLRAAKVERWRSAMGGLGSGGARHTPGEWSIQGLVNLAASGPDDGGLVVVPGTHLEHAAFFEGHPAAGQSSDWYKLTDAEKVRYRDRAIKVCAEPGDVLLWDSRTLHCNTVPTRTEAMRAVAYVCQIPADRVEPRIRSKRQDAWEERRTSTHHPGEGFRIFPKVPRFVTGKDAFWARARALQEPGPLSALQRALLCGTAQA